MKYNISIFCMLMISGISTTCADKNDITLSIPWPTTSVATTQQGKVTFLNHGRTGYVDLSILPVSPETQYPSDLGSLKPHAIKRIDLPATGETWVVLFINRTTGESEKVVFTPHNKKETVIGCAQTNSGLQIIDFSKSK